MIALKKGSSIASSRYNTISSALSPNIASIPSSLVIIFLNSQKRKMSVLSAIIKKIHPFTLPMITSFATTAKKKETFST
jgi:uncharacterized protein involved in tolerance to divalent cations